MFDFLDFQSKEMFEMNLQEDTKQAVLTPSSRYIILCNSKNMIIFKNNKNPIRKELSSGISSQMNKTANEAEI